MEALCRKLSDSNIIQTHMNRIYLKKVQQFVNAVANRQRYLIPVCIAGKAYIVSALHV